MVLLRYYFKVKKEFNVSRNNFVPVPNVDSVIVSFSDRTDRLELNDFDKFQKLVLDSFQFKRKNLKNNLKKYDLEKVSNVLSKYNYDLNVRAEQLPVEVFADIANNI